jgi:hypothetical protein
MPVIVHTPPLDASVVPLEHVPDVVEAGAGDGVQADVEQVL